MIFCDLGASVPPWTSTNFGVNRAECASDSHSIDVPGETMLRCYVVLAVLCLMRVDRML